MQGQDDSMKNTKLQNAFSKHIFFKKKIKLYYQLSSRTLISTALMWGRFMSSRESNLILKTFDLEHLGQCLAKHSKGVLRMNE